MSAAGEREQQVRVEVIYGRDLLEAGECSVVPLSERVALVHVRTDPKAVRLSGGNYLQ